jgi:phage terminase small subunit
MDDELKDKFKEYLISKNTFEEIDQTSLNEIEFNLEVIRQCKEDIKDRGLLINISQQANGVSYWNKNLSWGIYLDALKNLNSLLISLGLTLKERQKLKLAIDSPDQFDEIMKM